MPGIVNFNDISYKTSTGSILPVVLNQAETRGSNTSSSLDLIPSQIEPQGRYPRSSSFSSNYTVTQQGFTANVSCQRHDLSALLFLTGSSRAINRSDVPILLSWSRTAECLDASTMGMWTVATIS